MIKSTEKEIQENKTRKNCILCSSNNYVYFIKIPEFGVLKCMRCGLIQSQLYGYVHCLKDGYKGINLASYEKYFKKMREKNYKRCIKTLRTYFPDKGKILDIGCATGWFLKDMQSEGWNICGIEPSKTMIKYAKDKLGLDIINTDLENLNLPESCFDVVTMWDVLEHIPRPDIQLSKTKKMLKKNGVLIIKVPDIGGIIPQIAILLYKITLGTFRLPVRILFNTYEEYPHLFYFSKTTLFALIKKAGFEIIKIDHECAIETDGLIDKRPLFKSKFLKNKVITIIITDVIKLLNRISEIFNKKDSITIYCRKI
ncbi:MAG: class I SAM-dependent methyltransferase [Candidatus Omnitrophica bacterium]|nr:class I SAM-dependent methyltransferase [Candidatus Omnitrophota bacterium]